jgi:hypothetical protein
MLMLPREIRVFRCCLSYYVLRLAFSTATVQEKSIFSTEQNCFYGSLLVRFAASIEVVVVAKVPHPNVVNLV